MTAQIIEFAPILARSRRSTTPAIRVIADAERKKALEKSIAWATRNVRMAEAVVKRAHTLIDRRTFNCGPRRGMPHDDEARAKARASLFTAIELAAGARAHLLGLRRELAARRGDWAE